MFKFLWLQDHVPVKTDYGIRGNILFKKLKHMARQVWHENQCTEINHRNPTISQKC